MDTREVTRNYRLNSWIQNIQECRSSGQTIAAWCAAHDINPKTYYYWLRRVRTAACEALPALSVNKNPFVQVKLPEPPTGTGPLSSGVAPDVVLRLGPAIVEIHNTASGALIENTLRALQNVR